MSCIKHGQLPDNLVMYFLQPLATVTSKHYPPIYMGTQTQHMIMFAVAPPVSIGVDLCFSTELKGLLFCVVLVSSGYASTQNIHFCVMP